MSAVILLIALSALIGFILGTSFSWLAIVASSIGIVLRPGFERRVCGPRFGG